MPKPSISPGIAATAEATRNLLRKEGFHLRERLKGGYEEWKKKDRAFYLDTNTGYLIDFESMTRHKHTDCQCHEQ